MIFIVCVVLIMMRIVMVCICVIVAGCMCMVIMLGMAPFFLTVEDQKIQTERIKCCDKDADDHGKVSKATTRNM